MPSLFLLARSPAGSLRCANIDRGRQPNGLHWTCVVVVSASPLDALVCAPSILSEQTFRDVTSPLESRVLPRQFANHQNPRKLPQAFLEYIDFGFASVHRGIFNLLGRVPWKNQ